MNTPDTDEIFQYLLWFMTIFYVVVFLSGLFGNLSVIIVIVKSKGLHCAMNYYLISLAMADILIILLGKTLLSGHDVTETGKGGVWCTESGRNVRITDTGEGELELSRLSGNECAVSGQILSKDY